MTDRQRNVLIATLKGDRMNSGAFAKALVEADHRTLVEAAKECILKPSGLCVNRRRFEMLLETLLGRVTILPPLELAQQKEEKAGKGGK